MTSSRESNILYVLFAYSSVGYFISGIQITLIPAEEAAWIPASLSSNTIASSVFTPSFSHDFKKTSGCGLP